MISLIVGGAGVLIILLACGILNNAKTGPQSTLGALLAIAGFTVLAVGSLLRVAGH